MKKQTIAKRTITLSTLLACVLMVVSIGYSQETKDTVDISQKLDDARFDNNKQNTDAQFLASAAELNLEQIHLGQMAQVKGVTSHVKELGKKMEDAHTKIMSDLTALADSKQISLPNSSSDSIQKTNSKLNETSGDAFDKAYVNMMVSKHKSAIAVFDKASVDSKDADIKKWATATLSELRTHLNDSLECQSKSAKM